LYVFFVVTLFAFSQPVLAKGKQYGHVKQELNAYFDQLTTQGSYSGTVLVAEEGKVLLKKGYGMANYEEGIPNKPGTMFAICSMSKAFTAMSILMLEERGLLNVNDTVDKFIPEYPQGHRITIHQLLTHTSGIFLYINDPVSGLLTTKSSDMALFHTPFEVMEYFMDKPLGFEPGSQFQYCNSGYIVLGVIIERVSGLTYEEFVKMNILKPLKMNNTKYDPHGDDFPAKTAVGYYYFNTVPPVYDLEWSPSILFAAGGIYSTVEDLYKWDQALYTEKLVSKATLDRMFTPYISTYGYGWFMWTMEHNGHTHDYMQHSGAFPGFHSYFVRMVDEKITIILLENFPTYVYGSAEHFDLLWIADDVAKMVLGDD
jgi:CubicO group peptidase (beta-lactamase class C family)